MIAEQLAAGLLRLKGYRILARDFVHPLGEIDIVARRGDTIAFIEVKYRATVASAGEAINTAKRRRVANAASAWLAAHPGNGDRSIRFDAMLMVPWRLPIHIRDAWRV